MYEDEEDDVIISKSTTHNSVIRAVNSAVSWTTTVVSMMQRCARMPCLHWFCHLYASAEICPLGHPCASSAVPRVASHPYPAAFHLLRKKKFRLLYV
jgi:hypothetical protein